MFIALTLMLLVGSAHADQVEDRLQAGDLIGALRLAQVEAQAPGAQIEQCERFIDLLLTAQRPNEAERYARARIAAEPDSADARYLLGRALIDAIASKEAYEQALRVDPEHGRSYMGVAAVHVTQSQPERAVGAYQEAVKLDPTLDEAWLGLLRVQVALGRGQDAALTASQAIAAGREEPAILLAAASLLPSEARPLLKRGVAANPLRADLAGAYALALCSSGNPKDALSAADAALALDPLQADALRAQLVAHELERKALNQGQWAELRATAILPPDKAGPALDALIKQAPKSGLARHTRGRLRYQQGKPEAGLPDLREAVRLAPNEPEFQATLGLALLDAKAYAEAMPLLKAAVEAKPYDVSLGLSLTNALVGAGYKDDALTLGTLLADRNPGDPAVYITLADVQLQRGEPDAAWQTLKGALAASRVPDARLVVALVPTALASGHQEEAAALLERIAEAGGDPRWRDAAAKLRAK